MSWLWWLLAPVVATMIGALALSGFSLLARRNTRPRGRDGRIAITEHQAMLAALPQPASSEELVVSMRVLIGPGAEAEPADS
jgi:hypothetical protein